MSNVLQSLKPSITPINFTTQQPSGVPSFPPSIILGKKPSHILISGPSDQPSGITAVAMIVNTIHFTLITPTTFPSDVTS